MATLYDAFLQILNTIFWFFLVLPSWLMILLPPILVGVVSVWGLQRAVRSCLKRRRQNGQNGRKALDKE